MIAIEARLERVAAFFRLPAWPYDPEREVALEGPGTWYGLTVLTWVMMYASLLAMYVVSHNLAITLELGVLLTIALPVSYRLHHRRTSRLLVNWITFSTAFVLGGLQLAPLWPLRYGIVAADNVESMAFLVMCFMWVAAFRAFALRTVRDLVETILPCGSVILLTLVARPVPLALAAMALVVLSALALLAAQHTITLRQEHHPVVNITRSHTKRRAGAFYSWPTLYALVLVTAVGVSALAARSELSGTWADYVRYTLARQVMRYLQPRENYMLPEAGVMLWRLNSWPNSEIPVFRARTKTPGNWRTTAYHTYTGQWWQAGMRKMNVAPWRDGRWTVPMEGSGASRQQASRVEQEITGIKVLQVSLPAQFCPVSVQVNQRKLRYDRDWVLRIPRFIRPGETYKVVSYLPPVIPIKRAGTEVAAEHLVADLQLPAELPRRVRDLAYELTKDEKTPYTKAKAIEAYLMYEFKYTLEAPYSYPHDFVDFFLFESKRGFCHHFAGSMVILCRCIGLPARLVSGYLQGEEDKEDVDLYTVREKDAHVWPEVYFGGAGWTSFEPTPPAPEETTAFSRAWKEITELSQQYGSGGLGWLRQYWPSVALGLVGMCLLGGIAQWEVRGRYLRAYRGNDPQARAVRAYLKMRRLLAAHGVRDDEALAPREFVASLPGGIAHVRQEAAGVTENYLQARFSREGAPPEQVAAAEESLRALRRNLKRRAPADGT